MDSEAPARDALGYRFRVCAADGPLNESVAALFAGLEHTAEEGAEQLWLGPSDGARTTAEQLVVLMGRINLAAINAATGNLLLHAGAVAGADGGAAILCGPSGSGKTTLTIRLTESGLDYLSDEAVCLDPRTLRISVFRKPAVVKSAAQQVLPHLRPDLAVLATGTWLVPPAAFRTASPTTTPISPRVIIFPTFRAGARCRVEAVTEAEAAFLLGGSASRLSDVHVGPLPALARLARRAPAYRIAYGDSLAAATAVRDLLGAG